MYFRTREEEMEMKSLGCHDGVDSCEPLLQTRSHLHAMRTYDYVLVAHRVSDPEDIAHKKQQAFISQLKKKKMMVKEIIHDDKRFLGVRAPQEIFDMYRYLLRVSDTCSWSGGLRDAMPMSTRIGIVHFILYHTCINIEDKEEDMRELLKNGVFEATYCLHEHKKQKVLKRKWARWGALCMMRQPFDEVRDYFGEKVALYYLWLGWYTCLLVPAAVVGIVVFLYGLAFFNTSPLITEVCESKAIMCPRCDKRCKVWQLSDTCSYAKVNLLFDNAGTVFFAMVMAIWATLFLELWKRHRALHVARWNVYDWNEDEEELILELVNDLDSEPKEHMHSYLNSTVILILVTLVLMLIIGLTHALVICRVVAAMLLSNSSWEFMRDHANTLARIIGAVLHYITIQVMTRVNRLVAFKLCEIEKTRSFAATERNFTVKMFTFQFFTLFSSLIYVAFFLGRINGYPGNYVRVAGRWRLEECHPSGCLTDLFIQMAVILVLKQTINNIFEFTVPWFKRFFRRATSKKLKRKCGHCYRKACKAEDRGTEPCDICKLNDWLKNYHLNPVNAFSLFNEFLEMVIQFSFTTIFVAAFPLAPLLALINNIFEIRLDAIKMVSLERRLVPKKTNSIGVWTKILEAVGVMAVIANGLVIGVSSDFIPRLVYRYHYGPCGSANATTGLNCMAGYINDTLSTAYFFEPNVQKDFQADQMITEHGISVTQCSFKDYRSDGDHSLTSQFWLILAVRLAFVILFEHVVVLCKFIAAWFVPDRPIRVKNHRLKDKMKRLREELRDMKSNFDRSTEV